MSGPDERQVDTGLIPDPQTYGGEMFNIGYRSAITDAAAAVEALRDHCLRFRPEPGQSCKSMNPNGPAEHWCWQCKRGAVLDAALAAIREGARG